MTQYKDDDSKNTTCFRADSIHDLEPNTISLHMITESMNSSALRMKDNRTDGLFAWQSPGSPPNPITVYEKRWFVSLGYHPMFVHCSNLSIFTLRSSLFNNIHYVYDIDVSVDGKNVAILRATFTT
jgi:hypothetical protein